MCSNSSTRQIASRSRRRSPRRPSTADGVIRRGPWVNLSRSVESSRFERTVRTESSEIFAIYGGARRVGRIDHHYGRFEVHGTLLLEVDLTDDELQQVIDQIDEELVQTHDPERSEEHTSELQSLAYLVCRLLLEKKKYNTRIRNNTCYTKLLLSRTHT